MSNQLPVVQLAVAVPGVQGPAGPSWPSGGTTGQVLAKQSNANSDFVWQQISDANVASGAEIAVSKLADGNARQLLQTDSAGAGVEWTSNVDIPGTLDVTGATRLDSTLSVPLGSAAAPSIYPGTDTNTGIYSLGADQLAISTNGTGRLFVDASGRVGIGTASPAVACDVVGQVRASTGILFGSDTAALNALDDYEEGEWTPVFKGSTTDPTITYGSIRSGQYTKIGRSVFITCLVQISFEGLISIGSGNLSVGGLPFPGAGAIRFTFTVGWADALSLGAGVRTVATIDGDGGNIRIYSYNEDTGAITWLTTSVLTVPAGGQSYLNLSGHYHV
jgi:hypothetical protein